MTKKKLLKKIFLATISLIFIIFLAHFFWRYAYKTRASTIRATLNFLQSSINFKQNEEMNINFTLTTEDPNRYKISGIDLYFKFDLYNKDLLDFIDFSASSPSSNIYFDDILKKEVYSSGSYGGCKILRITGVTKKPDDQLSGLITFSLRFKAKKTAGSSSVSLHASIGNIRNQVVGITGLQGDNLFDLRVSRDTTNYTVNDNAICSQSSDCGQNAFCSSSQCYCNTGYYNCDRNWNNGCESNQVCTNVTNTPTPTPTPTRTPTPTPTRTPTPTPTRTPTPTPTRTPTPTPTGGGSGNVTLNLKLRFQGIREGRGNKTMRVRIKLGGSQSTNYQATTFTADQNGVWTGSVSFNTTPGQGFIVYVKGPKHIQKKVCDSTPNETAPGTYRCSSGKITLVRGVNNLDFSGILLLAGDLPEQDGIVNSYDTSLVRNNLGKNDAGALSLADINLDGIVNTQDHSLIIAALSVRADEE